MTKLSTLIALLLIVINLSAQPQVFKKTEPALDHPATTLNPVQTIGNFSITDSDGVDWDLYELLDSGKTVIIDLFFST
jgi:cytochrome oxidase Cu insertion factor (SCO1/SenC/PrrC family)